MTDRKHSRLWGEATAFLALFLDNAGVLIFLNAILVFTFNFPADIVLTRMIPGTAVGVFLGDLVYTWMAVRLQRKTGRKDVTAMPLGLDTPSTIGIAYAVLGPTYVATQDAVLTWHVGMATLFMIGVVKMFTSLIGGWIQRNIPTAGLLGSIGGVGLMLLGFLPMIEIFNEAIVGLAALGLIFAALYSRLQFPGRIHGVVAALLVGTGIHFALGWGGFLPDYQPPSWDLQLCLPVFSLDFFRILPQSLHYLPVAIPFGILTIVGGINNTESARLAGDAYRPRDILLTEAVTSLVSAFFGGVAQTTPYFGHPAYKKMGATWIYTLATGLLVGVGSLVGLMSLAVGLVPRAVIAPIFLFIGFEIVHQAYRESPPAHSAAVSLSMLPVIAGLVTILLGQFLAGLNLSAQALPDRLQQLHQTLNLLANGFILTGLLWGSLLAFLIDHKARLAALCAAVCGILTLFGVIHSVLPSGGLYLPWRGDGAAHYQIALAYGILSVILLILTGRTDLQKHSP